MYACTWKHDLELFDLYPSNVEVKWHCILVHYVILERQQNPFKN